MKKKTNPNRRTERPIIEVAYVCNGKVPNCTKSGCYYRSDLNGKRGPCSHTKDPKYAKNGARDPKVEPERFDKFKYKNIIRYYEKYYTDIMSQSK